MRRLLPPIAVLLVLLPLGTTASAGNSGGSPGQSAPTNTSAPTVTGKAVQAESLTASPGSWIGPNPAYSYQWNRCDSSGAACKAIVDATGSTYVLLTGDVGSTLRAVVTATNKNGTSVATSEQTPVIAIQGSGTTSSTTTTTATSTTTATTSTAPTTTATQGTTTTTTITTATTTTPPTTTTSSTPAYFADDFESGFGKWNKEPNDPSLYRSVSGYSGVAAGLLTTSSSYGPNTSSQMSALWVSPDTAHAGWAGGRVLGQDTWYHVRMKLPSNAYAPTTGQWNWLVEWHDDDHTAGYGALSTAMGIYTDYPVVSGSVGQNPRLVLRLAGGSSSSPTYQTIELPSNSLRYDHWYDLVFHFVWHTDSRIGYAQWWVDGTKWADLHFPTLFGNPDGTSSYNIFGLYNYHLAAPWTSEVDYDSAAIGPSLTSVGG